MPDSEKKKKWMSENSIVFSVKFMRTTEADMIEYMEKHMKKGVAKGTLIKQALRDYMKNHPVE